MFQSEDAAHPLGLCPFSMGSRGFRGAPGLKQFVFESEVLRRVQKRC